LLSITSKINSLQLLYQDDYGALEPAISGKIMELHHNKHHNTYVTSFNDATEKMATAQSNQDIAAQIALQPLINFHGGVYSLNNQQDGSSRRIERRQASSRTIS